MFCLGPNTASPRILHFFDKLHSLNGSSRASSPKSGYLYRFICGDYYGHVQSKEKQSLSWERTTHEDPKFIYKIVYNLKQAEKGLIQAQKLPF